MPELEPTPTGPPATDATDPHEPLDPHVDLRRRTRVMALVLVAGLVAVSVTIWTSPTARQVAESAAAAVAAPAQALGAAAQALGGEGTARSHLASTSDAAGGSTSASASTAAPSSSRTPRTTTAPRPSTKAPTAAPRTSSPRTVAAPPARAGSTGDGGSGGKVVTVRPVSETPPGPTKGLTVLRCSQFTWQQDAQAAYLADLTDPWGLDGSPGAANDDGLACTDLPVDPARAASVPTDAKVAVKPTAPSTAAVSASGHHFGMFTQQAPFNWSELDAASADVGTTPDTVGFFTGFDEPFRADAVTRSWARGVLPVMTWESRPIKTPAGPGTDNATDPDYQLSDIIDGRYDEYLRTWGEAAAANGLPVVVRLDHEMNGFWYPWSEQANGNAVGQYVQMWRHVHDVVTAAGATNVLWLWSPNVVTAVRSVDIAALYPGDDYVDWVGLSGYYRKVIVEHGVTKPATFDNTFGESLAELRAVTRGTKPILLSEIGATETGGKKSEWVQSLFDSLPTNPDVIGFLWFDMVTTAVPNGGSSPVTNDWRLDSTSTVTSTFRRGLAAWAP